MSTWLNPSFPKPLSAWVGREVENNRRKGLQTLFVQGDVDNKQVEGLVQRYSPDHLYLTSGNVSRISYQNLHDVCARTLLPVTVEVAESNTSYSYLRDCGCDVVLLAHHLPMLMLEIDRALSAIDEQRLAVKFEKPNCYVSVLPFSKLRDSFTLMEQYTGDLKVWEP